MNLSAVIRQIGLDIKELRQNNADKISPSQTNPVILHKKFNCICPALRQSVTIATGIGFDKYVAISAFVDILPPPNLTVIVGESLRPITT